MKPDISLNGAEMLKHPMILSVCHRKHVLYLHVLMQQCIALERKANQALISLTFGLQDFKWPFLNGLAPLLLLSCLHSFSIVLKETCLPGNLSSWNSIIRDTLLRSPHKNE